MGTTLTGLTPATTYDALIKVTDNGPLSATAKYLSDGLGNDSILALSSNKVGIGTFAPSQPLHVNGNMRLNGALYDNNNLAGTSGQILSSTGTATNWIDVSSLGVVDGSGTANYVSKWSDPNTLTNSLIYDNGTNVGIGTSSPASLLNLKASNGQLLFQNGTSSAQMRISAFNNAGNADADIIFEGYTKEYARITSTGNVGIGTSAPQELLHLNTSSEYQLTYSRGVIGKRWALGIDNTGTYLANRSDLSLPLYVTNTGNVGIGTSSPTNKLTIISSNTGTQITTIPVAKFANTGNEFSKFIIGSDNANYDAVFSLDNNATLANAKLRLYIGNGTNSTAGHSNDQIVLTGAGNVGIGTSSPVQRLSILAGNGNQLGLDNAGERFTQISFQNNSSQKAAIWLDETTDDFAIYAAAGYEVPIYANNVERVRVTNNGLTFNGDTAAANALDDYEEGSWTPAASSLTLNYTVTTANGFYTKIGNQVTVTWEIAWISVNVGGAGTTYISNLPFTSKANSFSTAPIWIESTAAGQQFFVYNDPNSTKLYVAYHSGGASSTNAPASIWGASNRFFGSLTYLV